MKDADIMPTVEECRALFDSLMPDPDVLYLICPYNFGDLLIIGYFCDALRKSRGKKSCALIALDKFKNLGISFAGVSEIIPISQNKMDLIRNYIINTGDYETERYLYGHAKIGENGKMIEPEIEIVNNCRIELLLSPSTPLSPPLVDELSPGEKAAIHAKYHLSAKNTIVISPYANSVPLLPEEFWRKLVLRLHGEGYTIYTNVAENESPIFGTDAMKTNFPEIYYISQNVRCFIGLRSGLFDFLVFSGVKILCISYLNSNIYNLKDNYPDKEVFSFIHVGSYASKIEEISKKQKIPKNSIKISFKNVNSDEVYYDNDDMMEAILRVANSFYKNNDEDIPESENCRSLLDSLTDDPDKFYVICPFNVGDFLINGGFCRAICLSRGKKSCALIVRDKFKNCGINFPGVSEFAYISQREMDLIRSYIITESAYETDRYIYGHFKSDVDGNLKFAPDLNFIDRYRKDVFLLPLSTPLLSPIVDEISEKAKAALHAKYRLNRKKTIVLSPYAYSLKRLLPEKLWIDFASRLKSEGYTVYTNVAGDEKPVAGTSEMRTNFPELHYIAGNVRAFVGIRSGIIDFLALSDSDILCVMYPEFWNDDVRLNYPGKKSFVFYYAGNYSEVIREAAAKSGVSPDEIRLDFKNVDPDEIYYSDDAIVEAMLNTVDTL